MSVRGVFAATAVVLALLTVGTALALGHITDRMHEATVQIDEATESVRAVEEAEVALLVLNRESLLLGLRRDPGAADRRQRASADLDRWLAEADRHLSGPREVELLASVRAAVDAFRTARTSADETGLPALEAYALVSPYLDDAYQRLEGLVELNLAQARQSSQAAAEWDRTADRVGLLLSVLLPLGVGAAIFAVGRWLYRPFQSVRQALVHFGAGDRGVRLAVAGPRELRELAVRFNEMADAVARQRETQLAFLAAIAHDLRNPLAALRAAVAVARRPGAPPEAVSRGLQTVDRQVGRIDRMVSDLLDLARIESGRFELTMRAEDLREALREVAELFEPVSERHELVLDLPGEPVVATCDAGRIAQVLANLVSNAIKYSPAGGRVTLRLFREGSEALIEVLDRGIGIAPEDQGRIFEPFRRTRASREVAPGVGLGLSVARRLVEAHGGGVSVESRPGEGSTFRVRLPLASRVLVAAPPRPPSMAEREEPART